MNQHLPNHPPGRRERLLNLAVHRKSNSAEEIAPAVEEVATQEADEADPEAASPTSDPS